MDLEEPHASSLFLEVYGTLPRAGPGGDEHTLRALSMVPGPNPRTVLDLGSGPGAQTACLARALPQARILAVDVLPEMVAEADRRLTEAGFGERVSVLVGDMAHPPVPPGSQDLIWCESAIYNLGITDALDRWRDLLRNGGTVAFTEPVWLTGTPPEEVRTWWLSEYPAITDDAGVRSQIEDAGFDTVGSFVMPASAWWDEYYEPMQARMAALRDRLPDDPAAGEVIRAAEIEIDVFERFNDHYSYAFYIVRPVQGGGRPGA